ncbi:MAG: alkaline phosphatase D family protein [Bacteroidota bacterium]
MQRRDCLKILGFGSLIGVVQPHSVQGVFLEKWPYPKGMAFQSEWPLWPDMDWVGPEYWANRLQDWGIRGGRLCCLNSGGNRNLHLLPLQKPLGAIGFRASVSIDLPKKRTYPKTAFFGMRLGAKGPMNDYRSAAVFGKGFDIGLNTDGELQLGNTNLKTGLDEMPDSFHLLIQANQEGSDYSIKVMLIAAGGTILFETLSEPIPQKKIHGNFALVADVPQKKKNQVQNTPSAYFSEWNIQAEHLEWKAEQVFGPICFAQYTVHGEKLKLTAQLCPIERIPGCQTILQVQEESGNWRNLIQGDIDSDGRYAVFSYPWDANRPTPYRILLHLPLKNGTRDYYYEGTLAQEPLGKTEVKAMVYSCNFHYGFPDQDVVDAAKSLGPDLVLFLGDQFYEGTGGFGHSFKADYREQCLDYLRKWYMFGWSYREIFRHLPCAIIPDDHDVYHGNIWGEGGQAADVSKGFGAFAQDSGGYKMPAQWVNMVQRTQTSHLPDPFDPRPVKQGIGVYYTQWNYGGISFAILEDRKFKSAPKKILPKEAQVFNGWILGEEFDIKGHRDLEADLLGKRQLNFLETWTKEWANDSWFKVVLSQTNFATVATLPVGAKTGAVIPKLVIPEKGEYIKGDTYTVDMDSNGWPVMGRNRAVEAIRKCFAFHIAGDQHLGSFVQYGLNTYRDSGYAFAGPALNNIWPRRFWPPVDSEHHNMERPAYVGNHEDGFGNKMTVLAVANPHREHEEPAILHDRAVGYGMVTFNKKDKTITTNCWPRFIAPNKGNQYPGWPLTIQREDNYGRKPKHFLPRIRFRPHGGILIHVYDNEDKLVYALRVSEREFLPWVFTKGRYQVDLLESLTGKTRTLKGLRAARHTQRKMELDWPGT